MSRPNRALGPAPHIRTRLASERRLKRSEDPLVALGILLDAIRRKEGYSTLAIADASGLIVAGSGHFAACEELAAHAPSLRGRPAELGPEVRTLSLSGSELIVAGNEPVPGGLESAVAGCVRILGRRLPKPEFLAETG